jgi:transposase
MMTDQAAAREPGLGPAGASRSYLCPEREQLFLLPVCMTDWLEAGHLAFFVLDVVGELDTSGLHARPGWCPGRPPYQPEMMCALVLYAYCCGIRSSRRIEAACRTDAAFRVICGGHVPDHTTIARFVAGQEQALESLFVSGLRLCAAAGLCDLSVVALDGTKIAADASIDRNRNADWIRREISQLLAVTGTEQPSGDESAAGLPGIDPVAEISTLRGRHARLQAAWAGITAQDSAERDAAEQAAAQAVALTEAAIAAAEGDGRAVRGRQPHNPLAALARAQANHRMTLAKVNELTTLRADRHAALARGEPFGDPIRLDKAKRRLAKAARVLAAARDRAHTTALTPTPDPARKANITDPDSRIMNTKNGWIQGYNAQAIANTHQIVLACQVTQNHNDIQLYQPMNEQLERTLAAAGITATIALELADAGYCSEHNLTSPGPDRLIATQKDHKQRRAALKLGSTTGPPPDGTPTEEMEHLLRTPQGAAAYKQRSHLIEPVFGDRKHNRQFRQFRRRGLHAAQAEWTLINLTGNLLKLHHHQQQTARATA